MRLIGKALVGISFVIYLWTVVSVLFLVSRGYWTNTPLLEYMKFNANFIPFKTIGTYISAIFTGSMNVNIPIRNLVGNVLLFLPMGLYLPFFFNQFNKIKIYVISMSLLLFSVEVVQLITRRGSFDIDDVILNMVGAFIGYGIWKSKWVQKYVTTKQMTS